MIETILKEGGEFLFSLIALLVACFKGNTKKTKTAEEIEAKEEARKQKRIAKQLKKNKIKPIENNEDNESIFKGCEGMLPLPEFKEEKLFKCPSWQKAFGVKTEEEKNVEE